MTPIPVPHRWLAMLLGAALLVDALLAVAYGLRDASLALPGAAVLAGLAYYAAIRAPVVGALSGAATLLASSVLIRLTDTSPMWLGVDSILLSELLAGAVLTVVVVWRATPPVSTGCVAALVVACLLSMGVRGASDSSSDVVLSLLFGFLVLGGCVATGNYLRRSSRQRVDTELSALVRRQWPLGTGLGVLLFVDIGTAGGGIPFIDLDSRSNPFELLSLAGAATAAVCAFFAPRAPLRYLLIAAAATAGAPLIGGSVFGGRLPLSFTGLAATMALIAFAVRQLNREQAVLGTLAIVAANAIAQWAVNPRYWFDANTVMTLSFLFIVAIATGLYFRARDRERTQTMRSAVTSAQQGERMALARELHDVVAHHVTGIVVQAQAALLVSDKDPQVAVGALERIERSGAAALTAMRTLVGSLRDGTMPGESATEQATTDVAADIRALVDDFPGPPVALRLELPAALPHEAGRSVLRVVQESLTNVGKHAPDAGLVQVVVRVVTGSTEDEVHIRVTDDGARRPVKPIGGSGGYGLVGMRERVELLGGRFEAGPSGYVGWTVEAWLPLRKESS